MQAVETDREQHFDAAEDGGLHVVEGDLETGDGGGHGAKVGQIPNR